jgi:hypothetical protein
MVTWVASNADPDSVPTAWTSSPTLTSLIEADFVSHTLVDDVVVTVCEPDGVDSVNCDPLLAVTFPNANGAFAGPVPFGDFGIGALALDGTMRIVDAASEPLDARVPVTTTLSPTTASPTEPATTWVNVVAPVVSTVTVEPRPLMTKSAPLTLLTGPATPRFTFGAALGPTFGPAGLTPGPPRGPTPPGPMIPNGAEPAGARLTWDASNVDPDSVPVAWAKSPTFTSAMDADSVFHTLVDEVVVTVWAPNGVDSVNCDPLLAVTFPNANGALVEPFPVGGFGFGDFGIGGFALAGAIRIVDAANDPSDARVPLTATLSPTAASPTEPATTWVNVVEPVVSTVMFWPRPAMTKSAPLTLATVPAAPRRLDAPDPAGAVAAADRTVTVA